MDNKKTVGLACLLVNIIAPVMTAGLLVGLGGVIYGATQKTADLSAEKYFKTGLIQLIASLASVVIAVCCVAGLSWAIVGIFGLVFYLVPVGMYVWSILDAVNFYRESQQ